MTIVLFLYTIGKIMQDSTDHRWTASHSNISLCTQQLWHRHHKAELVAMLVLPALSGLSIEDATLSTRASMGCLASTHVNAGSSLNQLICLLLSRREAAWMSLTICTWTCSSLQLASPKMAFMMMQQYAPLVRLMHSPNQQLTGSSGLARHKERGTTPESY